MSLFRLIKFELKKLFTDRTAHAGLIIIILVTVLISVLNILNRPVGTYDGLELVMQTVYLENSVLFLLPLIAILLAAQSISGEYLTGALKTLMTKPLKRENIIVSKFIALFVYMLCALYLVLVISCLIGLRWGYAGEIASFVPRILLIYLVYVLASMVLVAFTLLVASLGTSLVMTAIAAVGFNVVMMILTSFAKIQKYIYTHHVSNLIQRIVGMSIEARTVYQSIATILIYILALLLVASLLWEKRDIHVK